MPYRNAAKIAAALKSAKTHSEAAHLIRNLTVSQLLAVADAADVPISGNRKDTIARQLINGTTRR